MNKKNKEPLFHIVKRAALPWYQAWGIRLAALIAALVVCGILTTIATGCDPIKVYITMFEGSFSTPRRFWMLLQEIVRRSRSSLASASTRSRQSVISRTYRPGRRSRKRTLSTTPCSSRSSLLSFPAPSAGRENCCHSTRSPGSSVMRISGSVAKGS